MGHRYGEATTLSSLGDTMDAAGDSDAARRRWQEAMAILADLGHSDAEQVRSKLSGAAACRSAAAGLSRSM